jgi:hypothetical protein
MPIPSFDQLAADPDQAQDLPTEVARALLLQLAPLQEALRLRALNAATVGNDMPEDRALGLQEAARVLGMKPGTLYRKWRSLGLGYKDADGHVKFTREALERYIARRAGKAS